MIDINRPHLSFSGAGFLGIYHMGVIKAFQDYYPDILNGPVVGCSAGSLAAAFICCSVPFGPLLHDTLKSNKISRNRPKRALSTDSLRISLERILPADAYKRCNNRLYVSLTRWKNMKNELVCRFDNNDDLIDALVCSAHIPVLSGLLPRRFRNNYYWDGGITNNWPVLNEHSIRISPYTVPGIDICPQTNNKNEATSKLSAGIYRSLDKIIQLYNTFYPLDPQSTAKHLALGYNNAIEYFMKNGIVTQALQIHIDNKESFSLYVEKRDLSRAIKYMIKKSPTKRHTANTNLKDFDKLHTVDQSKKDITNHGSFTNKNKQIKESDLHPNDIAAEQNIGEEADSHVNQEMEADDSYSIQDLIRLIKLFEEK